VIHWHELLLKVLSRYLTPRQFVGLSAVLVGLTTAIAAILLKAMVYYIHRLFFGEGEIGRVSPFIYSFIPIIGILVSTLLVQRYFGGTIGGGNGAVIFAIRKKKSRLPRQWMYSHVITSAITVGTGGSTGLETPIVTTGAAIGANYARTYRVSASDRTLLLASGVAAGIAATFNAPIAGVLFAVEVLLGELAIASFIPILIASASGAILSKIILEENILLNFTNLAPFDYHNVPFYILLGLIAGAVSAYYIRSSLMIENIFRRVKSKYVIQRAIIGGFLLGCMILIFPPLFGEGYESIKVLANGDAQTLFKSSVLFHSVNNELLVLLLLLVILFLKGPATAITLGSGGNGGNFAPSLFTGGYLGFVFAGCINSTGWFYIPSVNFTVVAMGGILSGIFYAPLTGIFLIAEITGGYDLIVPLMIVSALSFAVSRYLFGYSLDGYKLHKLLARS